MELEIMGNMGQPEKGEFDSKDLRAVEPRVRRELRRHYLSERERLVADAVVEISLGLGIRSVLVPKLETLSELTGLDRSHVHHALKSLHEMRIVSIRTKHSMALYALNLDSEMWKVKPRVALTTMLRGLETIRELNGLTEPSQAEQEAEKSAIWDSRQLLLPAVADSATLAKEVFLDLQ